MTTESRRFFFVHIQKTAGTTLILRLRRNFDASAIYPTEADRDADHFGVQTNVEALERAFAARCSEIRLVTGHFPFSASEALGVPFVTLTVLREPVERTLSFLKHTRRLEQSWASYDDIYADPWKFHGLIANHMVKMLSVRPDEVPWGIGTYVDIDESHLAIAKRTLAERIDHFGIQEHFEVFCTELAAAYGWTLDTPRSALRSRQDEAPVSEELRARIAHDNRFDVELYRFASALWYEHHPEVDAQRS